MNPVFPERIVRIFYSLFGETNEENRNPCDRKGWRKFKIRESNSNCKAKASRREQEQDSSISQAWRGI